MKYRLSNNQKKLLLVRAQPLCIVLPLPADYQDDDGWVFWWSRNVLAEDGQFIVSAVIDEVFVMPASDGDGLTPFLGSIVADPKNTIFGHWAVVAVCHLDPPKGITPRHARYRPQWPAVAIAVNGKQWPEKEVAGDTGDVPAGNNQQGWKTANRTDSKSRKRIPARSRN